MRKISFTLLCGVLGSALLAGWAQSPPQAITLHDVAAALLSKRISVADEAVTLPSRVPTTIANPPLEIISVSSTSTNETKVKLRCVDARNCLPFYAVVVGTAGRSFEEALHPALRPVAHLPSPSSAHGPWLVRSGERATLVLEGQHLRIQMPVICLANGSAGKRIRVTASRGKQTYWAQVAGPGLLKGGL